MSGVPEYQEVIRAYDLGCPATAWQLIDRGGFSGARIWRVTTDRGPFCLRQWPPAHPSPERLSFIHQVLRGVQAEGIDFLPVPLANRAGQSYCSHQGFLWELTPWMPGTADFHEDPRPEKLCAALESLARFHLASASCRPRLGNTVIATTMGPSPGLVERCDQIHRLSSHELAAFRRTVSAAPQRIMADLVHDLLRHVEKHVPELDRSLRSACEVGLPLQPCIRDVWHDHVLFTGPRVTGIVDFGSLRVENVAADIARLVGSLIGSDADGWSHALAAYTRLRPLSREEQRVLPIFDRSGLLLSGINWLRWLYLEQRTFPDPAAVRQRLESILQRLESLP